MNKIVTLNLGKSKWIAPPNMVEHPPHYTKGNIEVLDFILDQGLDFLSGQVIKYVVRSPHKGSELEDLRKAKFCLERRIAELEQK